MYHKHNNFESFFMNKISLISNYKEIKNSEIKIVINKKSPTTFVVGLLKRAATYSPDVTQYHLR